MAIKLRAHHLLCMSRFTDTKWYSKKYEKNFKRIYALLKKDPKIKILNRCDDICAKCPNIKKGVCDKPSKYKIAHWIRVMDNKVMRLTKIKPNSSYSAKDLLEVLKIKANNKNLKTICKGCEYLEDCLKYKSKNKKS